MTQATPQIINLYSIDKLMHETRQLAARYRQTTGNTLPVTGEIARFDAAKALDLQLFEAQNQTYDAVGKTGHRENKRIVIKGRALFESTNTPRIGQLNPQQEWDLVLLVLFDEHYQPTEMFEADKAAIDAAMNSNNSQQKKRGAMSVAQFKIIGERVWTAEQGETTEIWSN